jgi:cytochrome b561
MNSASLRFWSHGLQAAAAVVIALSAILICAPALGMAIFSSVYFGQPAFPMALPESAQAYIRFVHGVLVWCVTLIAT